MEDVDTLKAERAVIESELKSTSPDMKAVFLQAAATGSLNEPLISAQSLGRAFGAFQQQVNKQPGSEREVLSHMFALCPGYGEHHQTGEDHSGGAGPLPTLHTGEGRRRRRQGGCSQVNSLGQSDIR